MPRVRRCLHSNCHALVEVPLHYCSEHMQHEAKYKQDRERYSRTRYNRYVRNRNDSKKSQYAFYRTKSWVHKRKAILLRDSFLCQYCKAVGGFTPNSKTVDHVTPYEVDESLKLTDSNLATTCRACHNIKTKLEQELYGTGQGRTLRNQQIRLSVEAWAEKIKRAK